jgi:hypothetical protein
MFLQWYLWILKLLLDSCTTFILERYFCCLVKFWLSTFLPFNTLLYCFLTCIVLREEICNHLYLCFFVLVLFISGLLNVSPLILHFSYCGVPLHNFLFFLKCLLDF